MGQLCTVSARNRSDESGWQLRGRRGQQGKLQYIVLIREIITDLNVLPFRLRGNTYVTLVSNALAYAKIYIYRFCYIY
jgi:hypothetical protein